jgi:hypothetical protein
VAIAVTGVALKQLYLHIPDDSFDRGIAFLFILKHLSGRNVSDVNSSFEPEELLF